MTFYLFPRQNSAEKTSIILHLRFVTLCEAKLHWNVLNDWGILELKLRLEINTIGVAIEDFKAYLNLS